MTFSDPIIHIQIVNWHTVKTGAAVLQWINHTNGFDPCLKHTQEEAADAENLLFSKMKTISIGLSILYLMGS